MQNSIVILSGGTATNDLVSVFASCQSKVTYILPISDNGGSTSEIIRLIGGPAIGDIRSRLVRLIPSHQRNVRMILGHRLSSDSGLAKAQWEQIVDGSHTLWNGIPSSTKDIIRSFLLHIHVELLKRSRIYDGSSPGKQFKFEFSNVGNLLLTAIRLFTGSLDSAIELFMKITDIDSRVEVLPCLNTNFSYHISAILIDGSTITGQSQISHPSSNRTCLDASGGSNGPKIACQSKYSNMEMTDASQNDNTINSSDDEVGNTPSYIHPDLKRSQLHFEKNTQIEPLKSPIKRIVYVSPYGEEICPIAQSRVINRLREADTLVYSIGSLMTSIVPIVILRGVGKAIAAEISSSKKRILLLNGTEDRETFGLHATDFVRIIVESAQYSMTKSGHEKIENWRSFVTHLFYIETSKIFVDIDALEKLGIVCVPIKHVAGETGKYDREDLAFHLMAISRSI